MVLENWVFTCKRMKLEFCHTALIINSKWIKDLNIRPKTVKLPEENVELDFGVGNDCLGCDTKSTNKKS